MGNKETSKDVKQKRQPCEIYSRVVGYIRPVNSWNPGKQAEYADRKVFDVSNVK